MHRDRREELAGLVASIRAADPAGLWVIRVRLREEFTARQRARD